MVEMGVIRGGVMVRTNAEKSSKKWFFIQKLPLYRMENVTNQHRLIVIIW